MPKHKQTWRSAEVVPQSNILLQAEPALLNRLRQSLSRTKGNCSRCSYSLLAYCLTA